MRFRYDEGRWYGFGLRLGLLNLVKNRLRLGPKKTAGKIFQPIISYSRFAEYFLFWQEISAAIAEVRAGTPLKVFDLGSPKLFGLYLAYHYDIEIHLTDISRLNLDEYKVMWNAIKDAARGKIQFEQQDGRNLSYPSNSFDIVYSMSVIEHVEGEHQDSKTACEAVRVLKPGGLLLLSVPLGPSHTDQSILGVAHAVELTGDKKSYFFQRIYDDVTVRTLLLEPILGCINQIQTWTISRSNSWFTPAYHYFRFIMGENVNGLIGFVNPIISMMINRHTEGVYTDFLVSYDQNHSLRDIYGDFVLSCRKVPTLYHLSELEEAVHHREDRVHQESR